MTSAPATREEVDCRRFLAAWGRFQATEDTNLDDNTVVQYQQMALHFQRLVRDTDELKILELQLNPVLNAIAALRKEEESESRRVARASEIAKLREERVRARGVKTRSSLVSKTEETMEMKEEAVAELRTDLSADDFKSMLEVVAPQEEKLSTKAIRKRLGLVDRSGGQTSASETVAREEQESIQSEMMSLAKQLKDRTQTINQSLAEDAKILDAVGQSAESNTTLLDRENTKLKQQLASSIGLWTSVWLVVMLFIVFVITYFYMKLFSRRW